MKCDARSRIVHDRIPSTNLIIGSEETNRRATYFCHSIESSRRPGRGRSVPERPANEYVSVFEQNGVHSAIYATPHGFHGVFSEGDT